MGLSTSITLRRGYKPNFPDRCVVCDEPTPNSHVSMGTNTVTWLSWLTLLPGSYVVVKAPACRKCAWRLYGSRWLGFVLFVVFALLMCWLIYPLLQEIGSRTVQKYAMLVILVLLFVPLYLVRMYFPRSFEVTANSDTIDYEFRDTHYAWRFYVLNEQAVIRSDITPNYAVGAKAVYGNTVVWPGLSTKRERD